MSLSDWFKVFPSTDFKSWKTFFQILMWTTLEVRGVFLDMSKAFNKVWHEGLIYKLRRVGITGEVLALVNSVLDNRFQRVILNGQSWNWLPVKAGVPQGSILDPLFFLLCINDLSEKITSRVKLFADNTSLFSVVNNLNISANKLNKDLEFRGYCSLWVFRDYTDQKFHDFYRACYSFWTIYVGSSFFLTA